MACPYPNTTPHGVMPTVETPCWLCPYATARMPMVPPDRGPSPETLRGASSTPPASRPGTHVSHRSAAARSLSYGIAQTSVGPLIHALAQAGCECSREVTDHTRELTAWASSSSKTSSSSRLDQSPRGLRRLAGPRDAREVRAAPLRRRDLRRRDLRRRPRDLRPAGRRGPPQRAAEPHDRAVEPLAAGLQRAVGRAPRPPPARARLRAHVRPLRRARPPLLALRAGVSTSTTSRRWCRRSLTSGSSASRPISSSPALAARPRPVAVAHRNLNPQVTSVPLPAANRLPQPVSRRRPSLKRPALLSLAMGGRSTVATRRPLRCRSRTVSALLGSPGRVSTSSRSCSKRCVSIRYRRCPVRLRSSRPRRRRARSNRRLSPTGSRCSA